MSGLGRITQEIVEALSSTDSSARITQEIVEPIGSVASTARVTQMYVEALCQTTPATARVTQLTVEPIGPPGEIALPALITQLMVEAIGTQAPVACVIPQGLQFYGNKTGLFYKMTKMGSETIPVNYLDFSVTINDTLTPIITQFLHQDGGWVNWDPHLGALQIKFSNGAPVRTIWVVTNLIRQTTPSVPVWASSRSFSLWKQMCTVPN